jgi:predicted secreted Zn-dependent protease
MDEMEIPEVISKTYLQNLPTIYEKETIEDVEKQIDQIIDGHAFEIVNFAIDRKTSHYCDFYDRMEINFDYNSKKNFKKYFGREDVLHKYKKKFLNCRIKSTAHGYIVDWT